MNPPAKKYRNRVLAALPKEELERLTPHLSPVTLKVGTELLDGDADHAYFLEEGLACAVLTLSDGVTVEVGVVGIDGVVGLPGLLGAKTVPGSTVIQIEGSGFHIDADRLKAEFERGGQLSSHLQKYVLANRRAPDTFFHKSASLSLHHSPWSPYVFAIDDRLRG
jgi:CRP-like cAMP-binding protein